MARRIGTIVCILLLLALFIFPPGELSRICNEIEALAEDAVEATLREDYARAHSNLNEIYAIYNDHRSFMHMLLHHGCVEELESAIRGAIRLTMVEDQPQTLVELEFIITHIRYLKAIESFDGVSLL